MSGTGQAGKRGYSWPPFTDGNHAAELSGARSPRRVGPLAAEIRARLLGHPDCPPHLHRPEFSSAVDAFCWADARCRLQRAWIDEQDLDAALADVTTTTEDERRSKSGTSRVSTSRRVTSAFEALRKWESHAVNCRKQLGLDPLSAARVAKELGQARYFGTATPLDRKVDQLEAARLAAIEAGEDD